MFLVTVMNMLTEVTNEGKIKAYCVYKLVRLAEFMYVPTLNLLTLSNSASFLKVE